MPSDPTPTDPIERAAKERAERERVVRGLASAMQGPAYGTATPNKAERALDYLSAAGLLAATAAQPGALRDAIAAVREPQEFEGPDAPYRPDLLEFAHRARRLASVAEFYQPASSPAPADDEAAQVDLVAAAEHIVAHGFSLRAAGDTAGDEAAIERMAEAAFAAEAQHGFEIDSAHYIAGNNSSAPVEPDTWDELSQSDRDVYRTMAVAALAALRGKQT